MKYQITTERADLFNVSAVTGIDIMVSGNTSKEEIITAFHKAVLNHEILNTCVQIDKEGRAFYVECKEHHNSVFFTECSLVELWKTQEKIRFQIEKGEYLKLFVKQEAQGFRMTFMLHRLGGDDKSLVYFIQTFMKVLNKESVKYAAMRRLSVLNLPANSKLQLESKMKHLQYNSAWQKEKEIFGFEDMQKAYTKFWNNHETAFAIQCYNSQKLSEIKSKAKAIGCHVTAYMITLYLQSKQGTQKIGLAVNARQNDNRAMGNQSTEIMIKAEYNASWSFEQNVLQVQKKVDQCMNNNKRKYRVLRFMTGLDSTLVDALNMQFAECFNNGVSQNIADVLGYGIEKQDVSLRNFAILDIPDQYGEFRIEKLTYIPAVAPYSKNTVGVITFRDEINVCLRRYKERKNNLE